MDEPVETAEQQRRGPEGPVRFLLLAAGALCTGLAFLGALLPVLPTTPFLLLAAWLFGRSSPALLARLQTAPIFGPYLEQWRRERSVPPGAKRRAYVLVVLSFALSIVLVESLALRLALGLIGLLLLAFLGRLPVAEPTSVVEVDAAPQAPSQRAASSPKAPR